METLVPYTAQLQLDESLRSVPGSDPRGHGGKGIPRTSLRVSEPLLTWSVDLSKGPSSWPVFRAAPLGRLPNWPTRSALPAACVKPIASRGSFDCLVLEQAQKAFTDKAAELRAAFAECTPAVAQAAAALEAGQSHVNVPVDPRAS